MTIGPDMPLTDPWNYCWQCGAPLWDWSTVLEMTTFLGRVALCRQCGKNLHEAHECTHRAGVLGYHDRDTWQRSKNRGK